MKSSLEPSEVKPGYLVASIKRETSEVKDNRYHRANKEALQKYIELFPEGCEAIHVENSNSSQHTLVSKEPCSSTQSSPLVSSVRSLLNSKCTILDKTVWRLFTSPMAQPSNHTFEIWKYFKWQYLNNIWIVNASNSCVDLFNLYCLYS